MKKDLNSILQRLEKIEENQMGQLQGGFASISFSPDVNSFNNTTNNCKKGTCPVTNNCHGANCGANCGVK